LLKKGGWVSFIATNNWITNSGASILRDKVLNETTIKKYIDFLDYKVFENASIQTMIFILNKQRTNINSNIKYTKIINPKLSAIEMKEALNSTTGRVENKQQGLNFVWFKATINVSDDNKLITFTDEKDAKILNKIKTLSNTNLTSEDIGNGIDVLQDFVNKNHITKLNNKNISIGEGIFVLSKHEIRQLSLTKTEREIVKPYYTSTNLDTYYKSKKTDHRIIYANETFRKNIKNYPNLRNHLDKFRPVLTSSFKPYGLNRPREQRLFEGKKILSLRKTRKPHFTYIEGPSYVSRAFMIIKTERIDNLYLTGFLNSSLINFWLYNRGKKQGDQLQIDKAPLLEIPIFYKQEDKRVKDIINLVQNILSIGEKIISGDFTEKQLEIMAKQQKQYEKEIDYKVYDIYELKKEDINLITQTTHNAKG
jgi:adenine-specific DNA-methyltransferase